MSADAFDAGAINLEGEPQTAVVETPPADPSQTQAPQTPPLDTKTDDDDNDGVPDTQKMVPLAALKETREHLKTVKAQLAEMEPLRQKAAQADQLSAWVDQVRPMIETLRNRPDLIRAAQAPPPEDPVLARINDEEAALYARDVQLYTADGKLDVAAGKRALAREHKIASQAAREAAEEVVRPVRSQSANREAQIQMSRVSSLKDKQGRTVPQDLVEKVFSQVPPELASDPNVASVLYFAVKGMAAHNEELGITKPPPVVETETPGGRTPQTFSLSDLDRRMARTLGRSTADYQKTAARFKPGMGNSLED